jgi:hypothetical protein
MIQFYEHSRWSEADYAASEAAEVNVEVHVGEETDVVYFVVRSKAFNKPLYKLKVDAEDLSRLFALSPFIRDLAQIFRFEHPQK